MSVKSLNSNAEVMGRNAALMMNIQSAKGLQEVMKTNLGPKGTVKMLVGGAGDLKLTKARARSRACPGAPPESELTRLAPWAATAATRGRDRDPRPRTACRVH